MEGVLTDHHAEIRNTLAKAQRCMHTKAYDQAYPLLQALADPVRYPDNPYRDLIAADLGYYWYYQGDLVQSDRCFAQSYAISPHRPKTVIGWCATLCDARQTQAAWDLLIQLPPEMQREPLIFARMVTCALMNRQLDQAHALIQQAAQADWFMPTDPVFLKIQAKVLYYQHNGEALADFLWQHHSQMGSGLNFYFYWSWLHFQAPHLGDGWRYYLKNLYRRFAESLSGPTLAVWNPGDPMPSAWYAGQGIGDQLFFLSALSQRPAVQGRIYVDPRLVSLCQRTWDRPGLVFLPHRACQETVVPVETWMAETAPEVSAIQPWGGLRPCPNRVAEIRARYRERFGSKKRIGIAWQSGNAHNYFARSIPMADWQPILACIAQQGGVAVGLQYDARPDHGAWDPRIHWDPQVDPMQDLEAWTAQIAAMDAVIAVDNSVIHIAGALGQKTACLLSQPADFRWLSQMEFARWYPYVRLYRQSRPFDWGAVCAQLVDDLVQGWIQGETRYGQDSV